MIRLILLYAVGCALLSAKQMSEASMVIPSQSEMMMIDKTTGVEDRVLLTPLKVVCVALFPKCLKCKLLPFLCGRIKHFKCFVCKILILIPLP